MKKKIETIDFREFVREGYKPKLNKFTATKCLSVSPFFFNPASIFSTPPPLVMTGYIIVGVLGGVLILAAIAENLSFKSGENGIGQYIESIISFFLPMAFIGALVYFVISSPLL